MTAVSRLPRLPLSSGLQDGRQSGKRPSWWQNKIVYEIYVRSFRDSNDDGIGDLNGVRQALPYLHDLGVDLIWLTPIYPSPNVDNGYDVSDYDAINPEFGTMDDFLGLVEQAHSLGIGIMLDQVLNHSSSRHPWFQDALKRGRESPYYDYYYWADARQGLVRGTPPNNWGSFVGGSAWTYVPQLGASYLHLFDREQPDLNWTNPRLRAELFAMLRRWLDRGVDGFRFDVINLIDKGSLADAPMVNREGYGDVERWVTNGSKVPVYLDELHDQVLKGHDTITVGETGNVTPEHALLYAPLPDGQAEGPRLDMVFQFELSRIDHDPDPRSLCVQPFDVAKFKSIITRWQTGLQSKSWNSLYWSNHDQPRAVSRFGDTSSEHSRYYSATMLATIMYGLQGTPYVYQGEEIGMTNFPFQSLDDFRDEDSIERYDYVSRSGRGVDEVMRYLRWFSRDNARTPFQWDSGKNAGFSNGVPWIAVNPNFESINADRDRSSPRSIFRYYQGLIRLRHAIALLTTGVYREIAVRDPIIMYARESGGGRLLVVANMSSQTQPCPLPRGDKVYGNYAGEEREADVLRPYEALWIFQRAGSDGRGRGNPLAAAGNVDAPLAPLSPLAPLALLAPLTPPGSSERAGEPGGLTANPQPDDGCAPQPKTLA
jgi:oligo-1,6-glucosidase